MITKKITEINRQKLRRSKEQKLYNFSRQIIKFTEIF